MWKQKYLHTKTKPREQEYYHRKRYNTIEILSDYLPLHESCRPRRPNAFYKYPPLSCISLYPLYLFLTARINKDWSEVYTEILDKTKPKCHWMIKEHLKDLVSRQYYYNGFVPTRVVNNWKKGKIERPITKEFFIDIDGVLRYFEEKKDLLTLSKKYERRAKLIQIFENVDKNQSDSSSLFC